MTLRSTDSDEPSMAEVATSNPMELLDHIQCLLADAQSDTGSVERPSDEKSLHATLEALRSAVDQQTRLLVEVDSRSAAMEQAQAEALVRSAEIIDELEQTKKNLSEARHAAEMAAQDTQRLADTVFERVNDAILVFQNQKCVACNFNAWKLLSPDNTKLIGTWPKPFNLVYRDEDNREQVDLRELAKQARPTEPAIEQVRMKAADAEWFWAEVTMSAFPMRGVEHVLVLVRDITARKNFETELRRNRDFLNNIINSIPDQLSVKADDGTLVVVNDAFCRNYEMARPELIGKNPDEIEPLHPALTIEASQSTPRIPASIAARPTHLDAPGIEPLRAYSIKRSVFRDDRGKRYVISTARDVTKARTREERLRLLASVFNNASEGVAILSPFGEILEANPAFADMSSAHPKRLVGQFFADTLYFDTKNFEEVLRSVAQGEAWTGKARSLESGNDIRSYWVSLSQSIEADEPSAPIIALVSDISELENTQAKLRQQAYYDNLTGLPNRRYFREHLTRELVKTQEAISICFLDLDDFKHVNDSAGHSAGDRLLKAVAKRIRNTVGDDTLVARFGGDEFAIISPNDPSVVDTALHDLLKAFREPFHLRGAEANVGLSIGVTRYPDDGGDVDVLMSNADIAMYAAKTAGKNQIRLFAPEMQQEVNLRTEVQTRLRRALSVGEVSLWYQPKWSVATQSPKGCEALVRWRTQDGTYVSPADFVPVAEQTGLILPLGDLVFELAAKQACQWARDGIEPDIAVNVSPQQMRHPRFVERLQSTLKAAGASPTWFELEITEHAVMGDVDQATEIIRRLNQLGFRVAIDDFGTGYSSLSYIKSFRLDTLKIDMSFVRDVEQDASSQAVVRSIVSLGLGLNMAVVAEGVESSEQAEILANMGCTMLQGYRFGKPMPPQEYMSWLRLHQSGRDLEPNDA